MHESDVRDHLRGVEGYRAHEVRSEGFAWIAASFVDDDWHYNIDYTEATDHLDSASAWKDVPLPEALDLVRALARAERTLLEVRGSASDPSARRERHGAVPLGKQSITFVFSDIEIAVDIANGDEARVRCGLKRTHLHGSSHTSVAACLQRTRDLSRLVEAAPRATGGRGEAVERLRLCKRADCASLEAMLERVASVTPDAPVADYVVGNLAEHVHWLAEHERVFTAGDDWRDAIVVGGSAKWFDAWGMNWTIQEGPAIDEASIQHVSGPFAYGTHRTMRGAREVYAVPDDISVWPVDEVIVSRVARPYAFKRPGKVEPVEIVAALGDTSVLLRGQWTEETERVVRLFVCAREAACTIG